LRPKPGAGDPAVFPELGIGKNAAWQTPIHREAVRMALGGLLDIRHLGGVCVKAFKRRPRHFHGC
jgi:hypothetical protein